VQTKKKLALAMTAMSIAALGEGIGAAAAQAQDEVLPATATTFTAGGSGLCVNGASSATFNAAGSATGTNGLAPPYPGTFTETSANVYVSARTVNVSGSVQITRTLTLSIPFTITSGSTTITGTVTNPAPYSGGSILCSGGSFYAGGPLVNATAAAYTATIQAKRQPAKKVGGTAQVGAAFVFRPQHVLGTPPTVTLLNFPSPLS
jgi:hypothetical protein